MEILFNTDHNLKDTEEFSAPFIHLIDKELNRFRHQITKVQAHLSDENGTKKGQNDKRCVLEAHLAGMLPIAVTNHGDNPEQAVKGAIEKLKTSLDTKIGKLSNH